MWLGSSGNFDWNGDGMQKRINWYLLLLKEQLQRRATWVLLIVMLFLLAVISKIQIPTVSNCKVGICRESSDDGEQMVQYLESSGGMFHYLMYDDVKQMKRDVRSGKLECAFFIQHSMKRVLEGKNLHPCVQYITNPYTTKGEIAKEAFFAAFLNVYSDRILKDCEKEIFGDADAVRQNKILASSEAFLEDDFFQKDVVYVDTAKKGQHFLRQRDPLCGILGLFLLAIMYFSQGRIYESRGKWIGCILPGREKFRLQVLQAYAAVTIPAVAGEIFLLFLNGKQGMQSLPGMFVFLLTGGWWIALYAKLSHCAESFVANGIVLILVAACIYYLLPLWL